jgi:hypothetical protein
MPIAFEGASMTAVEEKEEKKGKNFTLLFSMAALQIGNFLWKFFTPGGEFASLEEVILEIALVIALTIGLIGMHRNILALPEDDERRVPYLVLCWVALLASAGLLLIRFMGGDQSWWTGHRLWDLNRAR